MILSKCTIYFQWILIRYHYGKFADRRASNSIFRRPFASEGAFLTIKVLKKGTSEKEKQSLVLAMFPTIAETRKLAICIQHIVAMKRGYGEKLLVGGDSVTLTSNLLACVRRVGSSEDHFSCQPKIQFIGWM